MGTNGAQKGRRGAKKREEMTYRIDTEVVEKGHKMGI